MVWITMAWDGITATFFRQSVEPCVPRLVRLDTYFALV